MSEDDDKNGDSSIPYKQGDWIIDRNNPGQPGQYTGLNRRSGPHIMVQLSYPSGGMSYRPLFCLEKMGKTQGNSIDDRLNAKHFGEVRDLKRLITYEKLKGTLHDVIYSMEAAQIDFYPYQFKPVLKFINSPTERLIIADEVGLGKTIESALIWMELQARRQAQRLLVVCPKILAEKWRDELRTKFVFDARIVEFTDLEQEIEDLMKNGPSHSFVLIATYTGLRPPKSELRLLNEPPDEETPGSPKTKFLREILHWTNSYDPFDLVIFDEAHYMRNPATTTFNLGRGLAANAGAVLCVSATPVNNSNTDLHSLLRLTDESFFESQGLFEELLAANRPAVQAMNALSRTPVDEVMLQSAVEGMGESRFISQSPLFKRFLDLLKDIESGDKTILAKCQDCTEKLNLLGGYVNRTRRVQVKENRPVRKSVVLAVEYREEEMRLYQAIVQLVQKKCRLDSRPFHVFQVMGLQLRAASCLPALAEEIRCGRFGNIDDLMDEAMGEDVYDGLSEQEQNSDTFAEGIASLLVYNFEENDSKYQALKKLLLEMMPDEKVVIFAFYRPTLAYLRRRLMTDDVNVAIIHGDVPNDQRWDELDRFKDPLGPRVLLSSEVGSEGIDLQFCRVVVNYDLPWNPMRVEQRIGRIDRVGQQAQRLSIVNFKIRDTIEERLYDRLHSKLERFANSLGDLEDVIGREIQNLTVELFSKTLTPEEESRLMEQSERVIENRLIQVQALEESGDALIALSDYLQNKIEEDKGKGRYIQPGELEDYLSDFFERKFKGCEINENTPADGCLNIRLTYEAQASLSQFIRDDRSLSARPLRQREFNISFRRDALQKLPLNQRRSVHFANHISPLIRWITKINQDEAHSFFNVSALQIKHSDLPVDEYCYRIERWRMEGLSRRENLAYGIRSLNPEGKNYSIDESENIIQHLLHSGLDWKYVHCDVARLVSAHKTLENDLATNFDLAVKDFEVDNNTAYQIKVQRVKSFFDRRIAQDQQRIETLRLAGKHRMIPAAEGRLKVAQNNKDRRLNELKEKVQLDMEQVQVAAGVFRVIR